MIVMTAEEAAKIRGRSPKNDRHVLDPEPLKDGRFMLGEEVIEDPAHEDVRPFLRSLPREPLEKLPVYGIDDVRAAGRLETARLSVRPANLRTPDRIL